MNMNQIQWDALKSKGAAARILSVNPVPFKVGRSDGNWAVAYEQESPFGNGRKSNSEVFFRKSDALAWIRENSPVEARCGLNSDKNEKQTS